jgi:3',5'-cyclic AMP phosphodiesterase CpdA
MTPAAAIPSTKCITGTDTVRPVTGKLLLKFAIVADTHIRLPGEDKTTPWKSNGLSTERTRLALEQVKLAQPAFVIHLGDIVHPVPHLPTYAPASHLAANLIRECGLPFYFVPGNHDVGDKRALVTPAHEVDDHGIALFESLVSPSYSSFDAMDVHFVIINASLIGSGLDGETRQFAWLAADLEANRQRRIFLFSHYPLFMGHPNEASLYDNVERPGRLVLLDLIERFHIEAVFTGHVHNFFYHEYKGTEFYTLLSTAFVRHDYSELFDIAPADEFGRDDQDKLGWAEVEIYDSGHVVHVHRSLSQSRSDGNGTPINGHLPKVHPKYRHECAIGVHLRTAWAEPKSISYNGPIEEFSRRQVRNDYTLLALWEAGIRDLRVPIEDLRAPAYLELMRTMVAIGHRFTVFSVGVPDCSDHLLWDAVHALNVHVEIVLPWRVVEQHVRQLVDLRAVCRARIFVGCIVGPADHRSATFKGGYSVSFGFDTSEFDLVSEFHRRIGADLGLGYVFRVSPTQSPLFAGLEIEDFARAHDLHISLNISLGNDDAAVMTSDDHAIASRVMEALLIGSTSDRVVPFLDTLADHDRGYFPRHGLYDRRYNRRLASYMVTNFHRLLSSEGDQRPIIENVADAEGYRICLFQLGSYSYRIALLGERAIDATGFHPPSAAKDFEGQAEHVSLMTGNISQNDGPLNSHFGSLLRRSLPMFS